jgi:Nucleotidyltransferase/DNA polymerase involved in DNA repair
LAKSGIKTAADFIKKDEMWVKKTFGIMSLYTSRELKGHQAYALDIGGKPPKSIMVSVRSETPITTYEEMLDPLLSLHGSAARQLRKARQTAGKMSVFISTSRFDAEKYYANGRETSFIRPVSLDSDLMRSAEQMLKEIFIPDTNIKSAVLYSPIFRYFRGKTGCSLRRRKRNR